jgi:hypothetical protein
MTIYNQIIGNSQEEPKGYFKTIKITKLKDLSEGITEEIPESDCTIQTDDCIIQMEYVEPEDNESISIKPGVFSLVSTSVGVNLDKFTLKQNELLESIDNTSLILNEGDKFFNKIEVYRSLKKDPKRALLIHSPPGVGKTAAINKVCEKFLKDEGTCVIIWDTSMIRSSSVNSFFLNKSSFHKNTKKLILIMEDIDGGSVDDYEGGTRSADSSLLNLLDGVGNPFKGVPTFIIATTNNPETSVAALIDRPGRFDKVIELKTPNKKESVELLSFIAKRELTKDEVQAAHYASEEKFSIAHLQEIVVRSLIDDLSFMEVVKQLSDHKKKFKNAFKKQTKGIGLGS